MSAAPAQYLGRQDDLLYLIASKALSEGSYRLLTSPGLPPMTMITPGFPLLLLPLTWLAGERWGVYQAFCALILAACPWAIWWWLKDKLQYWERLLVPLAFASSPLVLSQAGTVMTEPTALLLSLSATHLTGYRLGFLLAAAVMIRPASLALLAGARKWQAWALPLAAWILWSLWSRSVSGGVEESRELAAAYGAGLNPLVNALENARYFLSSWGSCLLPARWGAGSAALAMGCLLAAAALRGARARLKKAPGDPAVWMLAGLIALHALWPWRYERYLLPLLPWLLWLAALGLGRLARPALAALVVLQLVFHAPLWALGRTAWASPELPETYSWLSTKTSPSEALVSAAYVRDGFYAGRPGLPIPRAADSAELRRSLRGARARWVLWQEDLDAGAAAAQAALARAKAALEGSPKLFKPVYRNEKERTVVYEVR